jgi:deoxyribodipyrimidine photo-lyase
MKPNVNIFWFRRDLRLSDNAALFHALKAGKPVVPIFIFDRNILDQLDEKKDRRVAFIHSALTKIQEELINSETSLEVYHGFPEQIFKALLSKYSIDSVFTNNDYELYAIERDSIVEKVLADNNTSFHTYKDHVIFEKAEILKSDKNPYTVFTSYSDCWKRNLNEFFLRSYTSEKYINVFYKQKPVEIATLAEIGFENDNSEFPPTLIDDELILNYSKKRDFPGANGTSKLGVHLRFGTLSIRKLVKHAYDLNQTFLKELIWREFYQMILWYFPKIASGRAFRQEYEFVEWRNNEKEFELWCQGLTGYPIVDAGMRELNETGFMHNRVRMIVASFLTKHLLIDWRWGEAYFAQKLVDYEFASNNGGWQWASGSGCDAVPYFRIFNPYIQTKKFDPQFKYIRRWVPEFEEFSYPKPIVQHEFARRRCLKVYTKAIKDRKEEIF